jgi:hypothetical protein
MREEIVIGGIYEHFKSTPENRKIYVVLGIAKTRRGFEDPSNYRSVYKVNDCEDPQKEFTILEQIADSGETKKGDLWINMQGNIEYVIYEQLYESENSKGKKWIREKKSFSGRKILDDGNKVRRFKLISTD